jgi:arylsulfatase A-like enzyme
MPLVLDGPVLEGAPPATPPELAAFEGRPPVVVYLMDTLRADKLGAYGSDQGLTPEIDAFASNATVFDHAIAQAPWTKPSVASIFTGVFARAHRIVTMAGVLPDSALTLAELFLAHGYSTGAVVTNGLVDADFGFDQGFDSFIRERGRAPDVEGLTGFRADKPAIDSDVAQARVWPWLDARTEGEPFLLYVHVLDPHTPHFPPEPFKSRFVPELDRVDLGSMESVRALDAMGNEGRLPDARTRAQLETLYDAEVAHNDHQFGLFLDELRARGLYEGSLIVLVSDHGEAFWEHGRRGHGKTLHEELLRVPLVVKAPGQQRGRRVAALAQHVDLLPTLADYAGFAVPEGLHGTSLRPLIELGDAAREGLEPVIGVSASSFGTAIREGRYKVVKRRSAHHPLALYDLEDDPGETRNLAARRPILARYLLEEVARREARTPAPMLDSAPRERAISEEKAEELRALGYIE